MSPQPTPTPLVTVILPTHNRAELLRRAIASVTAQTYPHWELIVVDDASTDSTAEVVQSFGNARVYRVRLPFNCGHPSRPRNVGWLLARGTYIAYIDDDNAWRPHHLERLVAAAEAHPEAAGAYGGRCHHAPDGSVEDIVDPDHGIDTGDGLHRRDLIQLMPEMWTETNFTNEDQEFWARLQERHPVGLVWVPEILSDYYIHAGNRYFNHWLNVRRHDQGYFSRNASWLDDSARWGAYVDWVTRLEPARVLDVGCGRGWAVRALRERGISAWGIDSSPSLAALTVIPGAFIRATADRLPFANGMFDVVLCTDVLAHIPDRFVARTLRDLVRVCGGYLVATIDCVDPTKEGHLTIRPRRWWLERLVEAGAEPVSALEDNLERERVCQRRDGLELVVCRTRPGDAGVVPLRWEVSEAKQPGAAARWPAAALSGRAV